MIEWMNCSDLPTPQHYHVISGMHGYLPDSNTCCLYKGEARRAMVDFKFLVMDQCESTHIAVCVKGNMKSGYVFLDGHGVEYAEIVTCNEDCKIGEDYR